MQTIRSGERAILVGMFSLSLSPWLTGCEMTDLEEEEALGQVEQEVGPPSPDQVPLDPATIPQFAIQLPIPRVFAPTVIQQGGNVIRHEYTVSAAQTQVQMLPPPLPATTVIAYGGQVKIPGSSQTTFVRSVPGPVFDNIRGIPSLVRWRNDIIGPHFLPIDPTLHWANPATTELRHSRLPEAERAARHAALLSRPHDGHDAHQPVRRHGGLRLLHPRSRQSPRQAVVAAAEGRVRDPARHVRPRVLHRR
jgi:hypothetical protein